MNQEAENFLEIAGEKINNWIDMNFTFENSLKRKPTIEDFYLFEREMDFILSQKGTNLFNSYCSKIKRLFELKFPNENLYCEIHSYTQIYFP